MPIIRSPTPDPSDDPPRYLATYERSLAAANISDRERARIQVEKIPDLLVVSGGDDQVWPSAAFAAEIVDRRAGYGLLTRQVFMPDAVHWSLHCSLTNDSGQRALVDVAAGDVRNWRS